MILAKTYTNLKFISQHELYKIVCDDFWTIHSFISTDWDNLIVLIENYLKYENQKLNLNNNISDLK